MGGDYFSLPKPRLFGHRGAAGVAPENTLESFDRALADGATHLELDVHATRDGVAVVIHDSTVDRTTDGSGAVRELAWAEIEKLDAGFRFEEGEAHPFRGRGIRVPTLKQVLERFPHTPLNIEIKQAEPPIERRVAALLEELHALPRVLLAAENDGVMRRSRRVAPGVATSFSLSEAREFFGRCFADGLAGYVPPGQALQIPARYEDLELVTPEAIDAAHRLGVEVHVWTINEPDEMERLFDAGVDGVMSDFPAMLKVVASRIGASSAPGSSGTLDVEMADLKFDFQELRRNPRTALGAKGTIRFPDGRSANGVFVDISFGGTRVEAQIPGEPRLLVGKNLIVEIPALSDRSQGKIGLLNGTVAWAKKLEKGQVSFGMKFSPGSSAKLKLVVSQFRDEPPR